VPAPRPVRGLQEIRPSFEEILRRTQKASSHLALRILGDHECVSDVLQEAYLNVYRSFERFRGESRYETWVYRIVVNAAIGHLRRRNRIARRELSIENTPPESAPVQMDPSEATVGAVDLIALLATVPEPMRALLVMRYGLCYSVRQIAEETGQSEANVKVRLYRARKLLAERFEREVRRPREESGERSQEAGLARRRG